MKLFRSMLYKLYPFLDLWSGVGSVYHSQKLGSSRFSAVEVRLGLFYEER